MESVWQLPVKQSNLTDHDWIHHNARYHYFVNGKSLCGKYSQDTEFFETSPEDNGIELTSDLACLKCLSLIDEVERKEILDR